MGGNRGFDSVARHFACFDYFFSGGEKPPFAVSVQEPQTPATIALNPAHLGCLNFPLLKIKGDFHCELPKL
jgi:hypothetical protein